MPLGNINPMGQRGGSKTSPVLWLGRLVWNTAARAAGAIERGGYSSRTIAVYFRKQGARIGEDCQLDVSSLGPEPYLVSIGNHVFISPGVIFHTHDGGVWVLRDKSPGIRVYGPITIEDNCIIGANTMLLAGVTIGRNSIVGAGSVVIADVPPDSIVMGVPARTTGSVKKYEEKCLARWQEQRPADLSIVPGLEWWQDKKNNRRLRKHLTELFARNNDAEEPPPAGGDAP
jgi:acetyltransferase-like isoleucine patch superfamily enzyme